MQDRSTSTYAVVAWSLWALTALLFITGFTVLALGGGRWGIFVAEVACGVSAFAAVMHIRYYAARGFDLIRACTRRPEAPEQATLHRVH